MLEYKSNRMERILSEHFECGEFEFDVKFSVSLTNQIPLTR